MTELPLPPHLLQRKLARGIAQALEGLGAGSVPYISIKGNRFLAIDAAGNEKPCGQMDPKLGLYLDVVIADSNPHKSKVYYANAYDPNASEFVPPTCYSDNGSAPSAQASVPQAKLCAACPNNQWGSETSRLTGKGTKACADVQKLAVLLPGQDMLFLLRVPPASLKHLGRYAMSLKSLVAGGRHVDISELVTRISFDSSSVGILNFQPVGFIGEREAAIVDRVWENKEADILLGKNDRPFEGELPSPAKVSEEKRLPPPAPAQAEEAPKRRGRPPKSVEAVTSEQAAPAKAPFIQDVANGGPSGEHEDIPAFLDRRPAATSAFGMAEPDAASDDMQARIAAALKLPTQ